MLTPEQIDLCLDYQPSCDEEVEPLSDKIVLARKAATCCMCGQPAPAGTHHRVETARVDGVLSFFKFGQGAAASAAM